MKLGEYIVALQELQKEHGDDIELHYAIDDEGNAFPTVRFPPSVKYVESHYDAGELYRGDISIRESIEEYLDDCIFPTTREEAEAELRKIIVVN